MTDPSIRFQRRHFEFIARTLRDAVDAHECDSLTITREGLAREFARDLRATNPQFNADRFLRACGVED